MKSKEKVQIRTLGGLADAPCFHRWKKKVGGIEFEFALHTAAGTHKGMDKPLAISEVGTGFDVKAVLMHPNSRNPLTENSVKKLPSAQVKKIARAAMHHLINEKVGPYRFLQAMVGAQMRVAKSSLESMIVPAPVVEGHAEPCAACGGTKVLTTTDKDHEGQPVEIACTECIPKGTGGVGFRFDVAMTPGDPTAGGDGVYDDYTPSQEEAQAAVDDADTMNQNMAKYGTIDKPDLTVLKARLDDLNQQAAQHGTMTGDLTDDQYEDLAYNICDLEQQIAELEGKPCSK